MFDASGLGGRVYLAEVARNRNLVASYLAQIDASRRGDRLAASFSRSLHFTSLLSHQNSLLLHNLKCQQWLGIDLLSDERLQHLPHATSPDPVRLEDLDCQGPIPFRYARKQSLERTISSRNYGSATEYLTSDEPV